MKTWTLVTKHQSSLLSWLSSYCDHSLSSSRCQENWQLTIQPCIEHSDYQVDWNDESECNQRARDSESISLKMKIAVEPFQCWVTLNTTLCLCVKNLWLGIWVTDDNPCTGKFTDTTSNRMKNYAAANGVNYQWLTNMYADCRYRDTTMHSAADVMLGYSVQ